MVLPFDFSNPFDDKTKKYFVSSIFFHILVLSILFFQKSINNFLWEDSSPQEVSEIIKVDVVGLPKLTLKELEELKKALDQNPAEKIENINEVPPSVGQDDKNEKNPEEIKNDASGENTNDSGLSLIEKLSKESGAKFEKSTPSNNKNPSTSKGIKVKKLNNLLLEGNQISKGNSIKGRYQGDVAQFDQYVLNLPNLIRPNWKLPSFLKEGEFQARIIVYINSEGRVIHFRFVSKSGNEDFDARAIKSINESQPFPLPNEEIKDRLLSEGVILGFPL